MMEVGNKECLVAVASKGGGCLDEIVADIRR